MDLPNEFTTRMKELLGIEYEAFIASYSEEPCYGLRANPLKISASKLSELLSYKPEEIPLSRIPWCDEGFYYNNSKRPGKSPFYHAGLFYIQEPSAMAAVAALDIQPGHKVLDLCAAPGGKSTHAAGKLKGQGLLVSNDISASRIKALVKNIELMGITNALVLNENPERLTRVFGNYFDRIILDAPCSGEGMFRRDADTIKSWSRYKSEACSATQRSLLHSAASMLAPGGLIMYSTCTFAPEENEIMIREFLRDNDNFKESFIDHTGLGINAGIYEYHGQAFGRIWPHRQRGEGHFLACIKKSEAHGHDSLSSPGHTKNNRLIGDISCFYEFCDKYLNYTPSGNLVRHGDAIYLQQEVLPSLDGIRIARSGFFLGEIKVKRFEPSQAFAMALDPYNARNILNFSICSRDIIKYLKGESFDVDVPDGYCLCCLENFPVGWGKVTAGRMKNKYLKSWVMG